MVTLKCHVLAYDKVQTASGRIGVARSVGYGDTVHVVWEEEGVEFPIRAVHLRVIERGCLLPSWYYLKEDKPHGSNN